MCFLNFEVLELVLLLYTFSSQQTVSCGIAPKIIRRRKHKRKKTSPCACSLLSGIRICVFRFRALDFVSLTFTYILNDAVALAPNPTARRRRLESGEEDCNDGATTSRAVRTMALRRGAGTETSVARRRARSKEVGCKGKEARYDEEQGARRPQWQGGGLRRQT